MATLTKKDAHFRELSLNGNMTKVVLVMGTPLALYALLNSMFVILDTLMASHVSSLAVSTVAYLSQLNFIVQALGGGLAVGASLKISQAFGAGDYEQVRLRLNNMMGMCAIIALLILICLPFTAQILKLLGTPEQFIEEGTRYFNILMLSTIVNLFNTAYIGIEKVRGNTKRIFLLNSLTMGVKLACSALFIYVLGYGIQMIAVATLIAYSVMFIFALINLSHKDQAFSLSWKLMRPKKHVAVPMINISYPISIEKAAFAMGKTVVNSIVAQYGPLMVGALGVSNNICGMVTNLQNGYTDGVSAIISQNLGANKPDRAIKAFKSSLVVTCIVSVLGVLALQFLKIPLASVFATSQGGHDFQFEQLILNILTYDMLGCLALSVNNAGIALLFGMGKTKHTLLINFCRVFLFRIPVLWLLQAMMGRTPQAVGMMMFLSNLATAVLTTAIVFHMLKILSKEREAMHISGQAS